MPLAQRLAAAGLSAAASQAILGTVAASFTAAGSNQGGAPLLPADTTNVTAGGAGTGVILPVMNQSDSLEVYNGTGAALLLYPPTGAAINGGSANAAYSIASATPYCNVRCINPTTYIATQGA